MKWIKSVMLYAFLTFIVFILLAAIFLLYMGYDVGNLRLAVGGKSFCFQGYKFDLGDGYKIIKSGKKGGVIYYHRGYVPFFGKESQIDYVMVLDEKGKDIINFSLNSSLENSNLKSGCLARIDCRYEDMIFFGESARVGTMVGLRIVEVPALSINFSLRESGALDFPSRINISKCEKH